MPASANAVAARFAEALDNSDWKAVSSALSSDCEYALRGTTLQGQAAVVGAYRKTDEWVKATFERVIYDSSVESEADGRVRIVLRDRMDHGEHHLDYRCAQLLTIDDAGLITHIEHVDLPGERDKADRFNRDCGVQPPK